MKKEMKELLQNTYKGDEVIGYIEVLEREVKALDEEGVMKCELNEKLSKALDKMINEHLKYDNDCPFMNDEKHNCDGLCGNKCWKAWCLKDD